MDHFKNKKVRQEKREKKRTSMTEQKAFKHLLQKLDVIDTSVEDQYKT